MGMSLLITGASRGLGLEFTRQYPERRATTLLRQFRAASDLIEEALDDFMLPCSFDLSGYADIENQNLVDHSQRVGVIFYQR